MIKGRVTGKIWSSRHVDSLPSGALLEVEVEGGGRLIAFDPARLCRQGGSAGHSRISRSCLLQRKNRAG